VSPEELRSRFYLRVNAKDAPGVIARVTTLLGEAGISLSAMMQHEENTGQFVPVVITTHEARRGDLKSAIEKIAALDVIEGEPVCIRIIEMPEG